MARGVREYPLIQGQATSWAEVVPSLQIHGGAAFKTSDFSEFSWSDTLTPGDVQGTGPHKVARTVGMYECEGQMAMYYAKSVAFEAALAAVNPKIGLAKFDLVISWEPLDVETGSGTGQVFTVKLVACRISSRQISTAPGPDALVKTYPLSMLRIEDNGRCLV